MRSLAAFLGGLLLLSTSLFGQRKPAFVVLSSPSTIEHLTATPREISVRERLRTTEGQTYEATLRTEKAPLVARIAARGIVIDWQIETVLNAVLVRATEADLAWLRTQPGVTMAEFAPIFHRHLDQAAKLINAPAVWNALPGGQSSAGNGVFIGILDSGIESSNPMFADSGFTAPSGFPKSDTTADKAYTNSKIIVARNYVCPAAGASDCTIGSPNLNASDGLGHGTGVASIAAGRPVTTPYNTNISGIAPGAYLGNYKIADASGSANSTAVISAINQAVLDAESVNLPMVLNFSYGGPSSKAVLDVYNTVVNNLVADNILMIVSTGNCGPASVGSAECTGITVGDSSISAPAELPGVLSAGATTNSHTFAQALQVTSSTAVPTNLQSIAFVPSTAPPIDSNIGPAPLIDITPYDPTSLGCNALPAGSLNASIAVILRGICNFTVKLTNAADAGAIAVMFYNNAPGPVDFAALTTGATTPSGIISASDGANLLAFLHASSGTQGLMNATATLVPSQADLVESYSSRGPTLDYNIKPDLVAPGDMYAATQNLYSTGELYDPSGFSWGEGTSYASPMTTGSAAVLKASRPTLSVTDIKSALVNTATQISATADGAEISVINMGAGRLNLQAAMSTPLTANPVSVSFGLITTGSAGTSKSVTLKNISTLSDTFTAAVNPLLGSSSVQVTTLPASITLAAGASDTLNIEISTSSAQGVFEGYVTLTGQNSGLAIHIPYWVMFGPPAFTSGGITDGAGFGQKVAPGSIITIFGTNLGGAGVPASTVPLPSDLAHSVVSITSGGTTSEAPMFYSSSTQLNLQMPFTALGTATAKVTLEGVASSTVNFSVATAAPGIFNYGSGIGVVLHTSNYSLVTASSPATSGEIVAIYCTGLGAVSPAVLSGSAAPLGQLSTTPQLPTVSIGGQNASVQFSGLASGFVGLYQVNATIPTGLAAGPQTMTLAMGANTSNSVTINIQ